MESLESVDKNDTGSKAHLETRAFRERLIVFIKIMQVECQLLRSKYSETEFYPPLL